MMKPGEKTLLVDGLRLRYADAGDGPVVVLVHGIATSLESWRFTAEALAREFRVLALDLPGFGLSERPMTLPTLEETADLMARFLDGLGIPRASFVGNSLGGLVSLETALRHPDRVDRLVLANSLGLGREIGAFWRLIAVEPIGRLLAELNRWAALRGKANLFYDPRDEPEIVALTREWVARPDLVDTLVGAVRAGLSPRGQRPEIVRLDRLPQLSIPTLLVWGRRDPIFPVSHGERAQRLIPDARLVVFENCGHCPQIESPLEFNRVALEFLGSLVD
jgi:4,5:9,10-diseco-3-hydroxy-5,9,17-trioxoandrosta-1(10),2-diene-4-oate hydrolase